MNTGRFLLPLLLLAAACAEPAEEASASSDEDVTGSVLAPAEALAFHTSLVADVTRCTANCADADRDGLVDAWEDAVLARFQPKMELDEEEKGVTDPTFRVGVAARVVPRAEDPSRVVVFFGFAWSDDYGSCGFTDHHGDVERAVLELARVPGTTGDVTIVKAFTAAHEGDPTDKSHLYQGDADLRSHLEFLSEDGGHRWLVYTSRNKHGTFVSKATCESQKIPCLADHCGADHVAKKSDLQRLPILLNAGEPSHPRDSSWAKFGYPNADAWSTEEFCGVATGGTCDEAPRGTLIHDPFSKKDL